MLGVTHPLVTKASGLQVREGRHRHSFQVAGGEAAPFKGGIESQTKRTQFG